MYQNKHLRYYLKYLYLYMNNSINGEARYEAY
jgi:hypothetical protein